MAQQRPPSPGPGYVPQFLAREQIKQAQGVQDFYMPTAPSLVDKLYDLVWPISIWCTAIINISIMASVMWATINNYDAWKHAQVAFISVGMLALQAIIYKWILRAPDGFPGRRYEPPVSYLPDHRPHSEE